ncbi:hypothetical protein KQ51_00249 [Candidatus Izimaplasma bacterium HR1]|jgi:ABC-type multidrug transport system fused ATPase/permease subunit|uniref:hypothetical protein n=1 Tax=Candidatus Izimoplasma sp. HR1 TaxID=1541959 RepID=UPI0004F88BBC|nr:hypothetical protein KQ51_00249 [Candidatus Izimaplasma bacterium HR1]
MKSYDENLQILKDIKNGIGNNLHALNNDIKEAKNQLDKLENDYNEVSNILSQNRPYIYDYLGAAMTTFSKRVSIVYLIVGFLYFDFTSIIPAYIYLSFMFLSFIIYFVLRVLYFKIRKKIKIKYPDIIIPTLLGTLFTISFLLMLTEHLRFNNALYVEFLYMYVSISFAIFYFSLILVFKKAHKTMKNEKTKYAKSRLYLTEHYKDTKDIRGFLKDELENKREEIRYLERTFRDIVYSDEVLAKITTQYCSIRIYDILKHYLVTNCANSIDECIELFMKEPLGIKRKYKSNI